MAKWLFTFLASVALFYIGNAQTPSLEIQGTGSEFYLNHTVVAKETFFSIGRLYNVAPRDIAAYNHVPLNGGLDVGQKLKVPLGTYNFTQSPNPDPFEAVVPLYHTVASGETLFRLGENYGKVPLDRIKQWNNLSSDIVEKGSRMVVGFLKVNKSESALAPHASQPVVQVKKPVKPEQMPKAEVKPAPKPEPTPEPTPKPEPTPEPELTPQPEVAPEEQTAVVQPTPEIQGVNSGYFQSLYANQNIAGVPVTENGKASVFKSTSGWQDKKYYCFYNEASRGSLVKITDPATGKVVYAKVLDAIPDIRRNEGLTLVLSNAGSDALGIEGDSFSCSVTYVK